MSGRFEQLTSGHLKQTQRLILSPQMKQALNLLKLPVLELSAAISEQLTTNPILEVDNESSHPEIDDLLNSLGPAFRQTSVHKEKADNLREIIENSYAATPTLYDHLTEQARQRFSDSKEIKVAEQIIGNLDEKGFLTVDLTEISLFANASIKLCKSVLTEIQTFDPTGIAARNLQEALLIQLKAKKLEKSLAYTIVKRFYEQMLHNKIPQISKELNFSTEKIYKTIQKEITPLELAPGREFCTHHEQQKAHTIAPDAIIYFDENECKIVINDDKIPHVRLSPHYLQMLEDKTLSAEARTYIQEKLLSGKSFIRNIFERNQTLYRIVQEIANYQKAYLCDLKAPLLPMTMKTLAENLELHESTIARACSNKYLYTPRGTLSFRSFFTQGYTTKKGDEISSTSVKELLSKIIGKENPSAPFSDEVIAKMIKQKGIACARRTVAKYRKELNIGNTCQRKIHR